MRRHAVDSVLVVASLIVAFVANYALFSRQGPYTDFYYMAWQPGRALMQGQNPYQPPYSALYPLWTIVLGLPFAWLPISAALASWALATQSLALGFLAVVAKSLNWQLRPVAFALVALSILTFRPSLATILHGQYAFVILFAVALTLFALRRQHYLLAGLLLGMGMVKPQLVFLTVPALLAWTIVQRRWSTVAGFLFTSLSALALSLAVLPGWVDDWLSLINQDQLQSRTFLVPSVWGLAHSLTASHWVAIALALSVVTVAALAWLLWRYRHIEAYLPFMISATVIVTQIVTPKTWNYDHAMLLLPFLYCLRQVSRPGQIAIASTRLWLGTLVGWILVLPYLLSYWAMRYHTEIPYALLPTTLGIVLLCIQSLGRHGGALREAV